MSGSMTRKMPKAARREQLLDVARLGTVAAKQTVAVPEQPGIAEARDGSPGRDPRLLV